MGKIPKFQSGYSWWLGKPDEIIGISPLQVERNCRAALEIINEYSETNRELPISKLSALLGYPNHGAHVLAIITMYLKDFAEIYSESPDKEPLVRPRPLTSLD